VKNSFELLEDIGSQAIYERTHISRNTIEAIIAKEFDSISRVQFNGFVAIIEREFQIDLRELKIEYNLSHEIEVEVEEKELAPVIKKESHLKKYIILTFVFIGITAFFLLKDSNMMLNKESVELNNSHIELAKENLELAKVSSSSRAVVVYEQKLQSSSSVEKRKKIEILYVHPKSNLWIGIVDLDTKKKRQFTTKEPIELNASKSYLISLGHGYVSFELDGEEFDYKEKSNIRFFYEPYSIKKISRQEFKKRNQGKNW